MEQAQIAVITNHLDVHADTVICCLQNLGARVYRINTEEFPYDTKLVIKDTGCGFSGYLKSSSINLDLKKITSVWYRRPERTLTTDQFNDEQVKKFITNESQATLANLYELTECFWVSHPDMIRKARHKLYQAEVARKLGYKIPRTIVTSDPIQAGNFYKQCNGNVVIKSLSGTQLVYNKGEMAASFGLYTTKLPENFLSEIESIRYCPVYLQEYVPKKIEIRITVVGEKVFSAAIDSQSNPVALDDWKRADYKEIPHTPYDLPKSIEFLCVDLVQSLGLAFGAIDMIVTPQNEYVFIEINPNGQWLWIEEVTGQPISRALSDLLIAGKI